MARPYAKPASAIAANHIEHIYTKLGISSRAAATLYATQHGLIGAFASAKP
jgi:ATP/maltotriose-dependent transcriptional regulator MalT